MAFMLRGTLVYDSSALSILHIQEVTQLFVTSQITWSRPIWGLLSYFRPETIEQNKPPGTYHFKIFSYLAIFKF